MADDTDDRIETITVDSSELTFYECRPQPTDVAITIVNHEGRTLVRIRWNGTVEYDPADLDEAAQVWWDAVATMAPTSCTNCSNEEASRG